MPRPTPILTANTPLGIPRGYSDLLRWRNTTGADVVIGEPVRYQGVTLVAAELIYDGEAGNLISPFGKRSVLEYQLDPGDGTNSYTAFDGVSFVPADGWVKPFGEPASIPLGLAIPKGALGNNQVVDLSAGLPDWSDADASGAPGDTCILVMLCDSVIDVVA